MIFPLITHRTRRTLGLFVSTVLALLVLMTPGWALEVSPGDRIELEATSALGVPLHRTAASSLFGRAEDGTIADVIETDEERHWLEIRLPDGRTGWITQRYVRQILPPGSDSSSPPALAPFPPQPIPQPMAQPSQDRPPSIPTDPTFTVATVNVANLDPEDGDRVGAIAAHIVQQLGAPDIIVLTDIRDYDGPDPSLFTDDAPIYRTLIDAIQAANGPLYSAINGGINSAPQPQPEEGQLSGTIRVGYLYRPGRVTLAPDRSSPSDPDAVVARFTIPTAAPSTTPSLPSLIFPNLSGEALRSRLATEYRVQQPFNYNDARDYLYRTVDNDNGRVRGIYSDFAVPVSPTADRPRSDAFLGGNGINAEHVWPQSLGATGVARSDLHHLFPARARVNSRRSNLPFADIDDHQTQRWLLDTAELTTIPTIHIDDYSESTSQAFEPREAVKGNIARAMFYVYTLYRDQADPAFFPPQQSTLCQWHDADPVDDAEIARSEAIATQQGNHNPFILDPTLADRLYCES